MNWTWKHGLTVWVLLAALVCLAAEPQSGPINSVRFLGVTVDETGAAETRVDVKTSQPTPYHIFRLENPKRLVLDLENAEFPAGQRTYPAQGPFIDRIRLGQLSARGVPVVRIVADLKQPCAFDVRVTASGILETLWSESLKAPTPLPAAGISPASPPQPALQLDPPSAPTSLAQPQKALAPESNNVMPAVIPVAAVQPILSSPALLQNDGSRGSDTKAVTPSVSQSPASPAVGVAAPQPVLNRPAAQLQNVSPLPPGTKTELPAPGEGPASTAIHANASPPPPPSPATQLQSSNSLVSSKTGTATLSIAQLSPPVQSLISASQIPSLVPAEPPLGASQTDPASQVSGAQTGTKYTGEEITLNLKDVDIKDFFRLIHEISGLNIIVDPNVSGTLTLALDDVPWDQALDIVLRNNSLNKVLEGNVLRIARNDTLATEADNQTKLTEAQAAAAPLVTVVRYLSYATAADVQLNNATVSSAGGATGGGITAATSIFGVASILMKMKTAIMSPRGMVTADPRDNAVVITDIPLQIPIIEAVVDKLDRKSKQVSIEARVVLTTNDVVRDIQTALTAQITNHSGSVVAGGTTGTGASATPTTQPNSSTTSRLGLTPTTVSGFGAFALSNLGGLYAINAAISAAETKNLAKTISAPTIVTQNNVPGLVQQGTQLFIQTTINNTVTSAPVNASLALAVTPQITDDGHIFLNIQVQNNSPGPVVAGTTNPEINIQGATTQVLVPDGGVVVFGGIKVTLNTKSVSQVPGLASIPVLGNFFKSTNREDEVNELIFIVSPKILPG